MLTFGNHDRETGLPNEEQAKIYAKMKNCICFDDLNDGRPDAGTFNVPIMSSDGSSTAMNIYVFDTGSKTNGVYETAKTSPCFFSCSNSPHSRGRAAGVSPYSPMNLMPSLRL